MRSSDTFQKFLKKFEVGQLHALDDFLTGETAKTQKNTIRKKPKVDMF